MTENNSGYLLLKFHDLDNKMLARLLELTESINLKEEKVEAIYRLPHHTYLMAEIEITQSKCWTRTGLTHRIMERSAVKNIRWLE